MCSYFIACLIDISNCSITNALDVISGNKLVKLLLWHQMSNINKYSVGKKVSFRRLNEPLKQAFSITVFSIYLYMLSKLLVCP